MPIPRPAYFVLSLIEILMLITIGFGSSGKIYKNSKFLDSKINGENPVQIGCIVSEKSAHKSVHRISAYTVSKQQVNNWQIIIHTIACPAVRTELESWSTCTGKTTSRVDARLSTSSIILRTLIYVWVHKGKDWAVNTKRRTEEHTDPVWYVLDGTD